MVDELVNDDHREQGVREHGQQRPALPGGPAADLVLVEPGRTFGGLEGFLNGPAASGDATSSRSGTMSGE